MNRLVAPAWLIIALLIHSSAAQEIEHQAQSTGFPQEFGQRAMDHVDTLVQFGPRVAGSQTEHDAAAYLRGQFERLHLDVQIEPFEFETVAIKDMNLWVCAADVTPTMVGFNPYIDGGLSIDAPPAFVPPDIGAEELAKLHLADHLVITADPAPFFSLMLLRPRGIAYLDAEEYASLAGRSCPSARLEVDGNIVKHRSANVVAALGSKKPQASELIITAHYDSYRNSRGADDNGSGVGVLLELARYFAAQDIPSQLRIRFVAFGAEELGVLGSRAYLDSHREELARCVLVINLDQVGGPQGPYVEMTEGVPAVRDTLPQNHFPKVLRNRAWEGMDGRWKLIDPRVVDVFTVSSRPPWLGNLISESAAAIACEVIPTGNMGGDQQVFAQAGITATGIGTSGNTNHGPGDLPAQVVPDQLTAVGRLTAEIAWRAMKTHIEDKGHSD